MVKITRNANFTSDEVKLVFSISCDLPKVIVENVIKTELPKFGYQVNPIYRIYLTGYNVPEITLFINRVEDGKLLSSKTLKALIKRATGVIGGLRSTLIELIHDSDIDSWIKREMDV